MAKTKKDAPRYFTKALRCPDGSRKYIRGKTKEELERKVMQAQAELGMGININDNTTVVQFAQMWVDVYKRPKLKPQSLAVVLNSLNTHVLPLIGVKRVRDVRPADCARVLAGMTKSAVSTQSIVRSTMKEMFECAVDNGIIASNPVRKSVVASGAPPRPRVPLTPEQMDELCAEIQRRGLSDLYTFVLLCGYAGLREGEALGLNLDNVDIDTGLIHVREQFVVLGDKCWVTPELKTQSAYRDVPMPPALLAHMIRLKKERETGYVFDVTDRVVGGRFSRRLSCMCKVDSRGNPRVANSRTAVLDFYVHPHLLRHTYATQCIRAGLGVKAVQYLMGHSNPKMTLGIYTHYQEELNRKETSAKLDEAFPSKLVALS